MRLIKSNFHGRQAKYPGRRWWLCLASLCCLAQTSFAADIALLEFELNDLTLNPNLAQETARAASLRPLLLAQLTEQHALQVAENPARARSEAQKGKGYLFDRPAIAAGIGREAGVDWIVSGRLHKASFLFVYLKAQLINTRTDQVAADFVVEIKGPQQKLTKKGVETLAVQITDALMKLGFKATNGTDD